MLSLFLPAFGGGERGRKVWLGKARCLYGGMKREVAIIKMMGEEHRKRGLLFVFSNLTNAFGKRGSAYVVLTPKKCTHTSFPRYVNKRKRRKKEEEEEEAGKVFHQR